MLPVSTAHQGRWTSGMVRPPVMLYRRFIGHQPCSESPSPTAKWSQSQSPSGLEPGALGPMPMWNGLQLAAPEVDTWPTQVVQAAAVDARPAVPCRETRDSRSLTFLPFISLFPRSP